MELGNYNAEQQESQKTISKSSLILEDEEEKKGILVVHKKIQKENRRAKKKKINGLILWNVQDIYLMQSQVMQNYFVMNGDVSVYILNTVDNYQAIHRKIYAIEELNKSKSLTVNSEKALNDMTLPIQLLEKCQSLQKYQFAQRLKEYQLKVNLLQQSISQIRDAYMNNIQELEDISNKRSLFRKSKLKSYLEEMMSQEDFFFSIELGVNFGFAQTNPQTLTISKSLFALIGLDSTDIEQYLLRNGISDELFMKDRETFFTAIFDTEQNERNKFHKFKDFQINTIDDIRIYCDSQMMFYNIDYPSDLLFRIDDAYANQNIDILIVLKYDIQPHHIQQVLGIRNRSNQFNDLVNQVEYSVLSQLFIEKYYPDKIIKTNQPVACNYRLL